jgi:hypothetical protein
MADVVEKQPEKAPESGGERSTAAEKSPDREFMTVKEAQDKQSSDRDPAKQKAETDKKVKEGAKDACNKDVGDGKAIANNTAVRADVEKAKAIDPNLKVGAGKLDFAALKDPSIADVINNKDKAAASAKAGDDQVGKAGAAKPEGDSLGGAENLALTRSGSRHAAAGDAGAARVQELGKGGEKPPGTDKNVERTPEQQQRDNVRGVVDSYRASLEKAGVTGSDAEKLVSDMQKHLETTQKRLEENKDKLIDQRTGKPDTPENQMQRVCGAINDVLEGKSGPYSDAQRSVMASAMAGEVSNPDAFNKQGAHMTCALASLSKQRLEAGDPASVLEEAASVVNRGGAFTGTDHPTDNVSGIGSGRTWTKVDATSIMPDGESSRYFDSNYHGTQGKRDLFTHVNNALYGQKGADLKAEHEGKPAGSYVYMAAHSDAYGGRAAQTNTGEGLFAVGSDGKRELIDNNPAVGIWQVAELNQSLTGRSGGMFAHKDLAGHRPNGYEHVGLTTFNNAQDFKAKLADWQGRTGTSAQIGVDAPFLPGGGEDGHGLHAMNAKLDANGNVLFINNWGSKFDMKVTDAQINRATNPNQWQAHGPGSEHAGPAPNQDTHFKPGSGTNPNETKLEHDKRLKDEDKKKQEEKKHKEEEKDKDKEKEQQQKKLEQQQKTKADYDARLAQWQARHDAAIAEHAGDKDYQFPESKPAYEGTV